jgi:parvulin-like peptidyl-prolyl isomerase
MTSHVFRRSVALVAASLVLVGASGCGSNGVSADAATITNLCDGADDVTISRSDFQEELQEIMSNEAFVKVLDDADIEGDDESVDARLAASLLTQHITQVAIDAEFEARDAEVTDQNREQGREQVNNQFGGATVVDEFSESFRNTLVERAARGYAVLDTYAVEPTEERAREYYEENREQFDCASEKEVSHILVADEARANEIMAQLQGGASFESLATQFSTDTGSAQQGGSLGCLQGGMFVEEFQTAAENATLGTPVGPVKTEFGYHVILVTPFENSFEAVQDQVIQAVQQSGLQDAQQAITKRLNSMKVTVDPRYGTWDEVTAEDGSVQRQVVPPKSAQPRDEREPTTTTTVPANTDPGGSP